MFINDEGFKKVILAPPSHRNMGYEERSNEQSVGSEDQSGMLYQLSVNTSFPLSIYVISNKELIVQVDYVSMSTFLKKEKFPFSNRNIYFQFFPENPLALGRGPGECEWV